MKKEIKILKKPEIYSYDEISALQEILSAGGSPAARPVLEKLNLMLQTLEPSKNSTAVFFMPAATYAMFSMFQGENAMCDFSFSEVEQLHSALASEAGSNREDSVLRSHLSAKLNILSEFMKSGNQVKPVPSQADCFEVLQL